MKRMIDVHAEDVMAGQGDVVLKSDAHRACIVMVAYDANKKIGALAHALYPVNNAFRRNHISRLHDLTSAVDEMIKDMVLLGSDPESIEVSLVTGENLPQEKHDDKYLQELHQAVALLKERHVRIRDHVEEEIGMSHVAFDVDSGKINYL